MHASQTILNELESTMAIVHAYMQATPQYTWPLLSERIGADVWVKHENYLPFGAFKIRGGVTFMARLQERNALPQNGVVAATRGNHGQSIAFAAQTFAIPCTIFVPEGNSKSKNVAMQALGAEVRIVGRDFQEALEYARAFAEREDRLFVPSFHPDLVSGVATYALELFRAVADIDTLFVPIGLGSGICGSMMARDALGLQTKIVGVVAEGADAYARSFERGEVVSTPSVTTRADGIACRMPDPDAFARIAAGVERIVRVRDSEIAEAMRVYFDDTHSVAESAGAAGLAALLREREQYRGKRVAVILCGGNVDRDIFADVLRGSEIIS